MNSTGLPLQWYNRTILIVQPYDINDTTVRYIQDGKKDTIIDSCRLLF